MGSLGILLHTTNGGDTWMLQNDFFSDLSEIHFFDDQNGWIVGGHTSFSNNYRFILHTSDGGQSWAYQLNESDWTYFPFNDLYFLTAQTGFVVGDGGVLMTTTNGGNDWIEQTMPTNAHLTSIDFSDDMNGLIGTAMGELLRTTDGGQTWAIEPVFGANWVNDVTFLSETEARMVTSDASNSTTVWRSTDSGQTWDSIFYEADTFLFDTFFLNTTTAWGAGLNGTIVHSGEPLSVDDPEASGVPASLALQQNYPNPFQSQTTIRFSVSTNVPASVDVFDVAGRLIKSLAAPASADGEQVVHWDGTNRNGEAVAAGRYFYRLSAGAVSETRTMVLIR